MTSSPPFRIADHRFSHGAADLLLRSHFRAIA